MYKPSLKRNTNQTYESNFSGIRRTSAPKQSLYQPNLAKDRTLVPQAFFQESKNVLENRKIDGLTAPINTIDFSYPPAIQYEITANNPGIIDLNEDIFCFYKQKDLYFWQYNNNDFTQASKIFKQTCEDVITSVAYKRVTYYEFQSQTIILVAIAYGQVVKFYQLNDFQKQNRGVLPSLKDMLISLYGFDIVTTISIDFQASPDQDIEKNQLAIVLGDSNGNIMYFDFFTKRKYFVDTIKQKLNRKIKRQTYSEIVQILNYRHYIFCLVNRHYQKGSAWKFLERLIKSPNAQKYVEQKVEVYKKQQNQQSFLNQIKNAIFYRGVLTKFKKHCEYSTEQIIQKIKGSHAKYFQFNQKTELEPKMGYIQSMSAKKGLVELMFSSGASILIDQQISFGGAPLPNLVRPATFSIIGNDLPNQQSKLFNNKLVRSIGSDFMLYQDFVACKTEQFTYISPYTCKQNSHLIRSLKKYNNQKQSQTLDQKYIIFKNKSFTLVQPLSPTMILFVYCSVLNSDFPYKKYSPQMRRFEERIQSFVDDFGPAQTLLILVRLLMRVKLTQNFSVNLRMDLFQLATKHLSGGQQLSYREGLKLYQQNQKHSLKNTKFNFTPQIEQMIWTIIFKIERSKARLVKSNQWNIDEIQSICVAFQITISEVFKQIKDWSAKKFSVNRNKTYKIIANAKALSQIIETYLNKQTVRNANKLSKRPNIFLQNNYNLINPPQLKSLKTKFCQLAVMTIQKVILLLNVYDYVCEMDLYGTAIPKFSDLLFNMSKVHRIMFANTVINTLGLNNQFLIQSIIAKIPELQLQQVRKFNTWIQFHDKTRILTNNDKTADSMVQNDAEEVSQIINEVNYKQIQKYFVDLNSQTSLALLPNSQSKRELVMQWVNGITVMLKASLIKIISLRKLQIQTSNLIQLYKKSSQNYFGVLELPTLQKKVSEILKQINFFVDYSNKLIETIFEKYETHFLTKQSVVIILEYIKNQLTIEIRESIQRKLKNFHIMDIVQTMSKRQLFTNKNQSRPQQAKPNNFIAQQISSNVARQYI